MWAKYNCSVIAASSSVGPFLLRIPWWYCITQSVPFQHWLVSKCGKGLLAGPKWNILLKHVKEDMFGFILGLSSYPEEVMVRVHKPALVLILLSWQWSSASLSSHFPSSSCWVQIFLSSKERVPVYKLGVPTHHRSLVQRWSLANTKLFLNSGTLRATGSLK